MDDVYLLNSPFTFQSMEKHAAYCAMMRLGLKVPETVLVPYKHPLDNARYAYTAARYNQPFDLDEVAERLGYPLFMKPYDGGAWVGVSRRSATATSCTPAYDASGERLMHLQQSVEGYDVFARSLSIGPETMVMKFRPELPMHDRYAVEHDFLVRRDRRRGGHHLAAGQRVLPVGVQLVRDAGARRRGLPDRLRQRLPRRGADLAALLLPVGDDGAAALDRVLRGHRPPAAAGPGHPRATSTIADRDDLSYEEKLAEYRRLADDYFDTERYAEFCASRLGHVDEMVYDWVRSAEFDDAAASTPSAPRTRPHEHDRFIAHFRGLIGAWVHDQSVTR